MTDDVKITTEKVINEFINYYCQKPLNFLYEADIQGLLFARLFDAFSNNKFLIELIPEKYKELIQKEQLLINPVKSEYPYSTIFDIGIIDKNYEFDSVKEVNHRIYNNIQWDLFWHLPLSIAIEIKFCQFNTKLSNYFSKALADLHKIANYQNDFNKMLPNDFSGVSLLFGQYQKRKYRNEIIDIIDDLKLLPDGHKIIQVNSFKLSKGIKAWIILQNANNKPLIYRYDYE